MSKSTNGKKRKAEAQTVREVKKAPAENKKRGVDCIPEEEKVASEYLVHPVLVNRDYLFKY